MAAGAFRLQRLGRSDARLLVRQPLRLPGACSSNSLGPAVDSREGSVPAPGYEETMRALEEAGTAQNREVYQRHGAREPTFGVSFADLGALRTPST